MTAIAAMPIYGKKKFKNVRRTAEPIETEIDM